MNELNYELNDLKFDALLEDRFVKEDIELGKSILVEIIF